MSKERESRYLNWLLVAIALFFGVLGACFALYVRAMGEYAENLKGVLYMLLPGFLALLLLKARLVWKQRFLFGLYFLLACELIVQVVAGFGLLPSVHTYKRVPFGRIYYDKEGGFANETMNRYGWHANAFRLDPALRKVALIGDSFILAAAVPARQHTAPVLEELLSRASEAGVPDTVIPLGISNTGPAHYLDVLSYAQDKFDPEEAIIVVFLGNDFANVLVPDDDSDRAREPFYRLDGAGRPALLPESEHARNVFLRKLDFNHRNPVLQLPAILRSHFLTPNVFMEVRGGIKHALERRQQVKQPEPSEGGVERELNLLGLYGFVFETDPSEKAEGAIRMVLALLDESRRYAEAHDITLRLATIPIFPPQFYQQESGRDWSTRIGGYDLELPERKLVEFAEARGIPMLATISAMRDRRMSVEEIHGLYFNGRGHFSAAGQRFLAEEIWSAFYAPPRQ